MRVRQWKYLRIIVAVVVLVSLQTLWAAEDFLSGGPHTAKDSTQEKNRSGDYGQDLLRNLLSGLRFPEPTVQSFAVLLERHGPELERMVNTQRDLVWKAIEVVIEVLPSLSEMDANGGRLRVPRQTYAKVSNLMETCESLASPELAEDLRKAKRLVEGRMSEADQETLIIDFKE
jgi:hypothetical protein